MPRPAPIPSDLERQWFLTALRSTYSWKGSASMVRGGVRAVRRLMRLDPKFAAAVEASEIVAASRIAASERSFPSWRNDVVRRRSDRITWWRRELAAFQRSVDKTEGAAEVRP